MPTLLAASLALLAGPIPASEPEAASLFATVGHSEFCPPGNVRLDLRTGRYTVRAPRTWRTCRRPPFRSRTSAAVLDADELAAVRAAYRSALSEGLDNPACRNGGRPDTIFISNGGPRTLRLIGGARTLSPPNTLTCWSEAALQLHRLLENMFGPRTARRG